MDVVNQVVLAPINLLFLIILQFIYFYYVFIYLSPVVSAHLSISINIMTFW